MENNEQQEWYNNKQLYEMLVVLSKGQEKTNAKIEKLELTIRDYNGLRGTLNDCKERLDKHEAAEAAEKAAAEVKEKVEEKHDADSLNTWAKIGYVCGMIGTILSGFSVLFMYLAGKAAGG